MRSIAKAPPGGRAFSFLTENVSADSRCLERRNHIRRRYLPVGEPPQGVLLDLRCFCANELVVWIPNMI